MLFRIVDKQGRSQSYYVNPVMDSLTFILADFRKSNGADEVTVEIGAVASRGSLDVLMTDPNDTIAEQILKHLTGDNSVKP